MSVSIARITAEHHETGFALDTPNPRLSWRFRSTEVEGWVQKGYEVKVKRNDHEEFYQVDSDQSLLVPWPSSPLRPREIAQVQLRATGTDGLRTDWSSVRLEASLLNAEQWEATMITGSLQAKDQPKRPFRLTTSFEPPAFRQARLYATAFGVYEVEINGRKVGDQVLAPGWTSYDHHLNYQTYDIARYLQPGINTITAHVAEGWYAGRLGKVYRNIWGDQLGFMGQLEFDGKAHIVTDDSWSVLGSRVLEAEIYNGEVVDTNFSNADDVVGKATALPFPTARLLSSHAPPIRRIMDVRPVECITTPSGKKVLDFGQNLVGWLRIERDIEGDVELRHAEVLEDGELGVRPLRTAMARDVIKGEHKKGWEPAFTFHGFRYAEVTCSSPITLEDFTAVVISSDLRRTGHFSCSHEMINRLHENVVWGMRGNFVSIPMDCPQRDERLGWTGDIHVFAPTANFLYDTHSFLAAWLKDVSAEQKVYEGVPPIFVPWTPPPKDAINPLGGHKPKPHGVWADTVAHTPWDLYMAFGDKRLLEDQYESMVTWLDQGVPRAASGLWSGEQAQYGDWLDPKAPPQYPAHGRTDYLLPANAYLVYTTGLVARIAAIIGLTADADRYNADHLRLRQLFRDEYITKNGRVTSDTQTALTLALWFDLIEDHQRQHAVERLEWLIRWDYFKISTGFAGTPLILPNLVKHGQLHLAYRMLQERDNPSWLYSVRMGATTIWERWDSMLPNGTVNPGQMTSFNHYALGSVATFMHRTIGGLAPGEAGWKTAIIQPQPGGTVTSASTTFDSPYGPYSVTWALEAEKLSVSITVPPNASAQVLLPGIDEEVGSGWRQYTVKWTSDPRWPPKGRPGPQSVVIPDNFVP